MATGILAPTQTPDGTGTTYAAWAPGDAKGYLEDVSRQAPRLITPLDAPFYKGLPKVKARAVRHDWETDSLPTLDLQTPPLFTAEPTYATADTRARPDNVIQNLIRTWTVSLVSELIAQAQGVAGGGGGEQEEIETGPKKGRGAG